MSAAAGGVPSDALLPPAVARAPRVKALSPDAIAAGDAQSQASPRNDPANALKREIREVFDMFDDDGSGTIDAMELQAAISTLTGVPMAREEAAALIHRVDQNGDGSIDFAEFYDMVSGKLQPSSQREEAKAAFMLFECKELPGWITIDSLREVAQELGERVSEERLEEMISVVSSAPDKKWVSFNDFLATQLPPEALQEPEEPPP
eukprot:TRINITY_DN48052_c0_g1_i1.p1 TRINITY_DN48052_c0_g1~~TRINITY_DN48052_c0_g1_i1.p1  ORF type:complete len:206 (+),score=53.23 TRINITY_DN48052_c0_g1_i1:70-687(+)